MSLLTILTRLTTGPSIPIIPVIPDGLPPWPTPITGGALELEAVVDPADFLLLETGDKLLFE